MTVTVEVRAGADPRPPSSPPVAPARRMSVQRLAAGTALVALIALSIWAFLSVGISVPSMIESLDNARHFFDRIGRHVVYPDPLDVLWLTALTLGIVITGTVLAAVLSVPVAYIAARNTTPGRGWQVLGRFLAVVTRALPDAILAMVFVLIFSIGTLPGILAIGIHSVGMISKLFADAIEQIDEGPRLAIRAAGGSRWQEFSVGVLPQVLPSWIATVLHRGDINLRGSVILGYVGVAGLGFAMANDFSALFYFEGLVYAAVLFVLCVVTEIVSSIVRARLLGVVPNGRSLGKRAARALQRRREADGGVPATARTVTDMRRRPWTAERIGSLAWGWGGAVLVVAAVLVCDIHWGDLLTVWAKIPEIAVKFWPPDFGLYGAATIVGAMLTTLQIALAATVVAVVLSLVAGSFAARNVAPNSGVRGVFRLLLVVVRGVPEVILAIVLIVITGLGAQAGTIALAFGGIGLLGKLIADSLEEVSPGPERALRATGATRSQIYAAATFPQGVPAVIGHSFYLLDTNVRAATILGIVGAGGVGYYLLNAAQGGFYPMITTIVIMMVVVVVAIEALAVWMRSVFR